MRRASLLSAALIYLSTSLAIIGCDKSAAPEGKSDKPIPPPIEIKTKNDNRSKLVKEDNDALPPPVRSK